MFQRLYERQHQMLRQDPQLQQLSAEELSSRASLAVRDQFMNLVNQDPNALQYSDEVASELINHESNQNYTEVANYLNQLAVQLHVNDGLPVNQQMAFNTQTIQKELAKPKYQHFAGRWASHENGYSYATFFDRQPMVQMDEHGNFLHDQNGNLIFTPAYFAYFAINDPQSNRSNPSLALNAYDRFNSQPMMPRVLRVPDSGSQINGYSSAEYNTQGNSTNNAMLAEDYRRVMNSEGQWTATQVNTTSQHVQQGQRAVQTQQSVNQVSQSQPTQANPVLGSVEKKPLPAGQFTVGQISRDDLLPNQVIYTSNVNSDETKDAQSRANFRKQMLTANWDHNNGKYFWRSANTANNSPVTVNEFINALDQFFPTSTMKKLLSASLLESHGTDEAMVEIAKPVVLTEDGANFDNEIENIAHSDSKAAKRILSAHVQELNNSDADVNVSYNGTVNAPMLLAHDGNLFSPSDVSKVQAILQAAQENSLDYTIAPDNRGRIYLKVNDNRGMRVTLLDIDNPSNIGATRDRSGNEYQVDWNNVMLGSSDANKRPVFSFVTGNGAINRIPEISPNQKGSSSKHYAVAATFMNTFDVRSTMYPNELSSLKEAYMNYSAQSQTMDPQMHAQISQELASDGGGSNVSNSVLDDERFNNALNRAIKKDSMLAYKSLPEDFQQFMAVAPMIEALGIDSSRMNSFQELAKKYGYTTNDVVSYGDRRLQRSISPTKGASQIETSNVYNPSSNSFEKRLPAGLNADTARSMAVSTDNSIMMRDSRFNNYTQQSDDYALSNDQANQKMAKTYRDGRLGLLRALNTAQQSDDDLYLSKVLDNYNQLVSDVARKHQMSLSDPQMQMRFATAYALVTRTVQNSGIKDGVVTENYGAGVLQVIDSQKSLSDKEKEATIDFANQLYRFINNEVGTAPLRVVDGYDRSPAHLNALRTQAKRDELQAQNDRANGRTISESSAKAELDQLGWYEEYGYKDGDEKHYYLDSIQEFTSSTQPSIQYGFDLVNAAKQTSDQFKERFTAHDPVQSKVIQQRMVTFDPSSQVYLSQMNKPLDSHLFAAEDNFNDWILTQFNDYLEHTGQKADLAHLNDQYQEWLNQLQTRDFSELGTYENQDGQLLLNGPAHAIVNADGELLHRLPQDAPTNWNECFVNGQLVNPQSKLEEQQQMLDQVYDTLTDSGIMVDFVDVNSGQNVGTAQQWINTYASNHNLSLEDAQHVFESQMESGKLSPDISIDKHGLVHWSGHQVLASNRGDVADVMSAIKRMHSDDPLKVQDGLNALNSMADSSNGRQVVSFLPVEANIGQFFVPDRRNILHTNYYTFSNLTEEQRAAVQDDEVAGYKAVIQSPKMINQRGDFAPEDLKNFNERLMLSSLQQVLHREIRENVRMQTAQLPITSARISDDRPLPFMLYQMSHLKTDAIITASDDEVKQILGVNHVEGELGRLTAKKSNGMGGFVTAPQAFSRDVLEQQMSNWYKFVMNHQNPALDDKYKEMLQSVSSVDASGNVHWNQGFVDEMVDHMLISPNGQRTGTVNFAASDLLARRDFTRPEDTTIVNKAYSSEIAATKLTRQDQFDAKDPADYDTQETLNRALYQAHRRMRLPNSTGEATNTASIVSDMQNIEDAVQEWMELHPGEKPFSTPNFEYEIKNRVHSRVQALGGNNIGMLADRQSLGYIDMLSTGQGKVQGLVRVLADNAQVMDDGHVKPAMIPVPMTEEDQKAYQSGNNDFDVMHVVAPDPDNPGKMKNITYKMSRYLDGNALTKDEIFKYLSKLPFDRGFIAVEQAVKADYIDKNATLALMNANIMNMEDGSIVSKHFADTHPIYGADGKLRSIETGDKLSDTSGDKTTGAIVIDPDMSLEEAQRKGIADVVLFMRKTGVDIIKSPLSQISRKNMSQVQDMVDSHDDYNPKGADGTVKIRVPKRVDAPFTDNNGHKYRKGDLLPQMKNGVPVYEEASDAEKNASYVDSNGIEHQLLVDRTGVTIKPILTDRADHRLDIQTLAKQDANWVKFMSEGGPQVFKDGHHFVDIEGHEQKSWPQGPIFEHNIERDDNGNYHYSLQPALKYEMDEHEIDTNTTIGRVTSYVTNIHADDKVNNYGSDPDATTEGRKYSDLVANADAERNATALTQYLTSVDSKAIPDFREYLKLAGFELSADGRVFTGVNDSLIRDTLATEINASPKFDTSVTNLESAAKALGMPVEKVQDAYQQTLTDLKQYNVSAKNLPTYDKLNTPQSWQRLVHAIQVDQRVMANVEALKEAQSHPGELRDHFSLEDMVNSNPNLINDDKAILNAISLANEKVSGGKNVWDLVSPLPPFKGLVDNGSRNINVKSGHQLRGSDGTGNRLDYQDQVANAMNLPANDPGHMNQFTSVEDALVVYTRNKFIGNAGTTAELMEAHQKNTIATSMIVEDGSLSDAQKQALMPLFEQIGLGKGRNGIVAVPDMNGMQKRLYNGQNAAEELGQMDAGSEFMEMINNSDGGELQLPDDMTVQLLGNTKSRTISILPQSLRKSRRSQSNGQTTVDDYTRDYAQIGVGLKRYQVAVKALEITMPSYNQSFFTSKQAFEDYTKQREQYLNAAKKEIWKQSGVQEAVDKIQDRMVNSVFGKDSESIKNNFVRQHIMSNRIKSSSTAVQTNGFDLPIDTIEVSPEILDSLGMKVDPKTGYAYSPVPGNPKDKSWDMVHVHRDPVWRSHGSLGFRVKVNPSIVGVRVSPVTVSLMDGDFDGDTIGLIAVADEGGQRDLHDMVNVLDNVYDQSIDENGKTVAKLGSSDLNISGELVDLAGRSNFNMDMEHAFGKMPQTVLDQTKTKSSDWRFGPMTINVRDKSGVTHNVLDGENVAKLYAMAQKLYPNDESLRFVKDKGGNKVPIVQRGGDGQLVLSDVALNKLNVKSVLKTYYSLGLDVATKESQAIRQKTSDKKALEAPVDGKIGWTDSKRAIAKFINNTNKSIRDDNPYRLEGAGVNAYISEDGKVDKVRESYQGFVERGAKGNMSALNEMMGEDYLRNQPLYSPEIMSYADAMHNFQNRIQKFCPEAYDEKTNTFNLEKINDPKEREGALAQFNDIQNNFFDDTHKDMFKENKKNIERQLGLLSTVMDATKEKSDLTGQPGGWQKKLVAALADKGPEGLQIANAIGYVMTQATLQVKHDPVLAHKLGDIEVNGMQSLYNGNYEKRPLMLGLVGNRITKSGSDTLVPLGKNSFVAGVNQQMLKSYVDSFSAKPGFLKQHGIDLVHNDFSFHKLNDKELVEIANKLTDFNPADESGNHLLILDENGKYVINGKPGTKEYQQNMQTLAEGFDLATRPMFSDWDKETGLNKDDKLSRFAKNGKMTPKAMAQSLDKMLEKSQVKPPIKIERLVDMMTTKGTDLRTKEIFEYIDSLNNMCNENAGTLMQSKMKGIGPVAKMAAENTDAVLKDGKSGQSLFTQEDTKVYFQTVNERKMSIDNKTLNFSDKVTDWLDNYAKSFKATAENPQYSSASDQLNQDADFYSDLSTRLKNLKKGAAQVQDPTSTYQRSIRQLITQRRKLIRQRNQETGQVLSKNQQTAMILLGRLDANIEQNAARKQQIPNDRANRILSAQQRLLKRRGLPTNLNKWKAVATTKYSQQQISHIEDQLTRVSEETARNFDNKKQVFIDEIGTKNTSYMSSVFRPSVLAKGGTTVAAIQKSRADFTSDSAVQQTLKMNDILIKAVKDNHLEVGGLKKTDGKSSQIEQALIAKDNCQKIVSLYKSSDVANQQAFKRISKSLNEVKLPIGDHKQANKFGRQISDMLDGFDIAQGNLEFDPTVRQQVQTSDAAKASDKEMADFKKKASETLSKFKLDSNTTKRCNVKTTDGTNLRLEAQQEHENPQKNQYAAYLQKEAEQKRRQTASATAPSTSQQTQSKKIAKADAVAWGE